MPEKDYYEKRLEDYNDVFADILNVLLFDGKSVILPEELETGMSRSAYKTEGKFEEQERDVKKYWKKQGIRIATAGVENQTAFDNDLAFRIIGYDGAEYHDQYRIRNEIKRENKKIKKKTPKGEKPDVKPLPDYTPVVTIVLYFSDRHWKGPRSLKKGMKIPEGMDAFVSDYQLSVFEIAYLTDEQVTGFKSDFRYVAEFFVQNRREKEGKPVKYKYSLKHIRHVHEFMNLMNALTGGRKFDHFDRIIEEEGNRTMITVLDRREKRGEKRGEEKLGLLISRLAEQGRMEDIVKVSKDRKYREELYRKFNIASADEEFFEKI